MGTLNEKLAYLAETKAAIKNAIVEKGQTVKDTDTFRSYADKIRASQPKLDNLEVTENGEYIPPAEVDGYSKVNVAVPIPTLITDARITLDFSEGDMSFVAPGGSAVTAGIIKKPENLIPENIAKDVEIAGIVGTHEGGGGTVAGTATITFCNYDGTELYSRLVFVGDDCADPIAQGKINEPTRESTAANTYAYDGWSLTQGGAASASALKVVTEDRTVYAAYTANVRYYTVRFYDGTTLMQEPQLVAYGSKATPPDTTKTGYEFVAWTPSDLTIYGDTDFHGEWVEFSGYTLNFTLDATGSLDFLQCKYGKAGKYFAIIRSGSIDIYDVTTTPYTLIKKIDKSSSTSVANDCAFSDDESLFAIADKTSSTNARVEIYETETWQKKHTFAMKSSNVPRSLTFARGNEFLYVGASYNELYNVSTLSTVSISSAITNGYGVCSTGNFLFAANSTGGLKCYKYVDGAWSEITLDGVPASAAQTVAITNNGRKLFVLTNESAGNNAFTLTYDETNDTYTYDGYLTNVLLKAYDWMGYNSAAFNPDGSILAVNKGIAESSARLTLIDMTTTPETQYYNLDTMPTATVYGVSYSANGAHFAYIEYTKVRIFNTR